MIISIAIDCLHNSYYRYQYHLHLLPFEGIVFIDQRDYESDISTMIIIRIIIIIIIYIDIHIMIIVMIFIIIINIIYITSLWNLVFIDQQDFR
jgi:hypothetical protein